MAKILIVEDNALNIKLFCDLLAAHGHQPEAVTDSRNALDVARQFSPDLVITDIQLPHVSGLELIRMLRADEQLADVPIMAVTAYSARGDEERIREAGAQAYVSKPISVVRFAATVEELLPTKATSRKSMSPRAGRTKLTIVRTRRGRWRGRLKRGSGSCRDDGASGSHLILASLKSTCLRTFGSYLRMTIFSVWVRGFFLVT